MEIETQTYTDKTIQRTNTHKENISTNMSIWEYIFPIILSISKHTQYKFMHRLRKNTHISTHTHTPTPHYNSQLKGIAFCISKTSKLTN